MDINTPLALLGGLTASQFMRKHWHKQPLLVRQAIPGFKAPIPRARLLAMAGLGAVVGPVALAWGLQRTSGSSASLMLTLEALFTALLAWRLYHETMDRRVWAAMLLLLAGGVTLVVDQGRLGGVELAGLLDILGGHAVMDVFSTLLAAGLYQHLYKWYKAMAHLCLNAIHFFQIDSLQFCIFYDIVCCAAGNKAFLCLRVSQRSLRKEPGFYLCFLCK